MITGKSSVTLAVMVRNDTVSDVAWLYGICVAFHSPADMRCGPKGLRDPHERSRAPYESTSMVSPSSTSVPVKRPSWSRCPPSGPDVLVCRGSMIAVNVRSNDTSSASGSR